MDEQARGPRGAKGMREFPKNQVQATEKLLFCLRN